MIINKKFADFIYENSDGRRRSIYIATVANGVCMAALIFSLTLGIGDYSQNGAISFRSLAMFALALGAFYVTQSWGGRIASESVLNGLGRLELQVMDGLRRADYAAFKEISPEHVYAAVGGDKYGAVMAARFLIPTMSAMVVVALTGFYLLTVSVPGALIVGGVLYGLIRVRGHIDATIAERKGDDDQATNAFTTSLRDIVEGFNELKMNRRKSDALFNEKIESASAQKNERLLDTEMIRTKSITLEQATLFLPLGLTLFLLPTLFAVSAQDLVTIISVTLIVIWPAYTLVQFGPVSEMAASMIARLEALQEQLENANLEPLIEDGAYPEAPAFEALACRGIAFTYPKRSGDKEPFTLRIGDFSLTRGEMVIMRGGNGSGKSTFMRILAALEKPTEGELSVNGETIAAIGEANYRALFSIVMADFHLFDRFYGYDGLDSPRARKWMDVLDLSDRISMDKPLPTLALSSGQKKRMALLAAILEDRQILLFDEVAADFDPYYREKYYRQILPALKAEGRTLLVISHDDRYYDVADRVVTMSEGALRD
ncbi:MAG: ATP-binding cassette domain-containing protein [Oscillospiraceae bacterium]|jgi:putative ATP-binding cassette transporter|nr:ATP-binding cassette domain-containing protein [Oscillospiraceae bacterium]